MVTGQIKRQKEASMTQKTATAVYKMMRVGPQKLNLVAAQIRGMKADDALNLLKFSHKRVAADVEKTLTSAVANAENNHGLDIDRLYVSEAYVGHGYSMKRFRPRAKGRASKIKKLFSRLTVVVEEQEV